MHDNSLSSKLMVSFLNIKCFIRQIMQPKSFKVWPHGEEKGRDRPIFLCFHGECLPALDRLFCGLIILFAL